LRAQVIEVLRGGQQLEELDNASGPAAYIAGQLLDHARGAFAAAIVERVRYVSALAESSGAGGMERADAKQVANVRDNPLLASFNEPVFVEAEDVEFDRIVLSLDQTEERAQRLTLIGVAQAIDGRQQTIETVLGVHAHAVISVRFAPSGFSSSNCAG